MKKRIRFEDSQIAGIEIILHFFRNEQIIGSNEIQDKRTPIQLQF